MPIVVVHHIYKLPVTVGDIVIVHGEGLPWCFWKFGRTEEVMSGQDGRIRTAIVPLSAGRASYTG